MQISKFLKSIGFSICICILLLFVKNEYTCKLMDNMNYGIPALINKGSVEELYIGSSMFRQGLDINTLTEDGTDAYILAYNGNQPYLESIILQKLIKEGVKIDRLFIDMYAYTICERPDLEDKKILLEINTKEKREVYSAINHDSVFKLWWQYYVSSNMDSILTWPINSYMVNKQFYNGGTVQKTNGTMKEILNDLTPPNVTDILDDNQIIAINKIVELCNNNDIELIFIETPKYDSIMNSDSYLSIMNKYKCLLDDKNIRYILADGDMLCNSYDANDFIDLIHLSYSGRLRYTKDLVNILRSK